MPFVVKKVRKGDQAKGYRRLTHNLSRDLLPRMVNYQKNSKDIIKIYKFFVYLFWLYFLVHC